MEERGEIKELDGALEALEAGAIYLAADLGRDRLLFFAAASSSRSSNG
jgi:hypothetical protein